MVENPENYYATETVCNRASDYHGQANGGTASKLFCEYPWNQLRYSNIFIFKSLNGEIAFDLYVII